MMSLNGNRNAITPFCLGLLVFFISFQAFSQTTPSLKFIENKNQWADHIDYAAKVPGGRVFLSSGQFSIYLWDQQREQNHAHEKMVNESDGSPANEGLVEGHYVQINFLGANESSTPQASGRSTEYYNYFLGNDSAHWASRAYAYSELLYPSIYNGIDVKISSVRDHLKYDFIVKAEADPSQIKVEYCGADRLTLEYGTLSIETSIGELLERKPYSYQMVNGEECEVQSEFQLHGNVLTFKFPQGYDPCLDLVIDPLLIFSTFSGSTADNWGSTATPGENGTLYSSGITNHHLNDNVAFPATPGAFQTTYGGNYDIAILKYDSTGSQMLYASYLGGSSNETPHSLVMDKQSKDLIVLGTTSSLNFPTTVNSLSPNFLGGIPVSSSVLEVYPNGSDIIVSRISSSGDVLKASTYLGGTSNDGLNPQGGPLTKNYGDEMRGDVITDDEGNIFISSVTSSSNFPAINSFSTVYKGGASDAVLVKLDAELSSVGWGIFFGGSLHDASHTLKFDNDGNIYFAGGTTSTNLPASTGAYQTFLAGGADGWIAHVTSNGTALLQATYTGTNTFDQVYFVDLNLAGEVHVYGQTNGIFPVTPGVVTPGITGGEPKTGQFVQKFNSTLTGLIFSTVFGSGSAIPNISPTAFLVNDCNNLYMSGWGGATNNGSLFWPSSSTFGMVTTTDALQRTTSGSDFYFIVLTADATELLYATFLGGNQTRTHVDGGTSRFDKSGIVYHAVCAGCGGGFDDFPTTPGAWSRTNNSTNCNNAAFKFDLSSLRARIQTNSVVFDAPGLDVLCFPDTIRFQNYSTGGEFYEWDLGDGTTLTKLDTTSFIHQYQEEGVYIVTLKAIDQNTCIGIDIAQKEITVFKNAAQAQEDDDLCFGTSYALEATGGVTYAWSTEEDGLLPSNLVSPEDTTQYFVTITDSDGCVKQDTVLLNVVPKIEVKLEYELMADCFSRPSLLLRNKTKADPEDTFFFDFGDGFTSDAEEVTHHYEQDGEYLIRLVGIKEFCDYEEQLELPIFTILVPNVITPDLTPGLNDKLVIQYGEVGQTPADVGLNVTINIVNRWGKSVFESNHYQNDWMAKDVEVGIYYYQVTIGDYATCKSWVHVIK